MPRSPQALLVFGLAAAACLALAACGGEDAKLLPGETAREITANLDTVQQLSDEGDCVGAESAAQQVGEQIEALEGVDQKLKLALEDGATRLEEVITGCEEASSEDVAPATIPVEPEEGEEEAPKKKDKAKEKEAKPEKEEEVAPEPTTSPSLPPQANGEGKGPEGEGAPPAGEEGATESPSGGVSPASPAGGGE